MTEAAAKGTRRRPYPAWWLERAAARKRLLDGGVERLRRAVRSMEGVRSAIVFGSYARDAVGPHSDLDIIFIRQTDAPPLARLDDIYAGLDLGVPFDAIVYTPAEFTRLRKERSFVAQAADEGLWIDATASR